jgi:hypothetical protein
VDSDRDNGYADITLPGIAEALRDGDPVRGAVEVDDLRHRIQLATQRLTSARAALPNR